MAKTIDYSKIKAMAKDILECIGEDEEGENPDLPKPENNDSSASEYGSADTKNDGGQSDVLNFVGNEMNDGKEEPESSKDSDETAKKKKDSSLAMMGSVLASKFGGK